MAFGLPEINFSDAKTRVLLVFGIVAAVFGVMYVVLSVTSKNISNQNAAVVANAPSNLKSIPGSKLTPDYYRALVSANNNAAKDAAISGDSAVPTLLNNGPVLGSNKVANDRAGDCVSCTCVSDNIKSADYVNKLIGEGRLSSSDAKQLLDLSKNSASISAYATALNKLVKEGKLTPADALRLLHDYTLEHKNSFKKDRAAFLDPMIASGKLSVGSAQELLDSSIPCDSDGDTYSTKLADLVSSNVLSAATASDLLAQHTTQNAAYCNKETAGLLDNLLASGKISPAVAKELADYQNRNVSLREYKEELDHLVKQGRLSPEQAQALYDSYQEQLRPDVAAALSGYQKSNMSVSDYENALDKLVAEHKITPEQKARLLKQYAAIKGTVSLKSVDKLLENSFKSCDAAIDQALVSKMIKSSDVVQELKQLNVANLDLAAYQKYIDQLVRSGKLSPSAAPFLLDKCTSAYGVAQAKKVLVKLAANNSDIAKYILALKQEVADQHLTPDQAKDLLDEYKNSYIKANTLNNVIADDAISKSAAAKSFAELQNKINATKISDNISAQMPDFRSVPKTKETKDLDPRSSDLQDAKLRAAIEEKSAQMSTQANQLIGAWNPVVMVGQDNSNKKDLDALKDGGTKDQGAAMQSDAKVLIRAGSILYAVLDTAANSDSLDAPVMATITQGEFKGSKLLGKLKLATSKDGLSLEFSLMSFEQWPKSKAISAFAVDPDTAKYAMASDVNNHYFVRYGGIIAASFVQGYATAVSNAGTSTSSSAVSDRTSYPDYSPGQKLIIGLGAAGTQLGQALLQNANIPPTVQINSGVGIGILFMQDLT